jgi:Zn-finger nucleic acid-binding protein
MARPLLSREKLKQRFLARHPSGISKTSNVTNNKATNNKAEIRRDMMRCPKCPGTLEPKTYGRKITVHRCTDCGGLFCKPQVLVEMKKEWMADAVLDTGDRKLGEAFNKLDNIDCPECGTRMNKAMDERQTHIWFEQCPACEGMFFDAGEFSDLKYDTFMDRVRGLLRGKRPT